jgi:hypothetical protein
MNAATAAPRNFVLVDGDGHEVHRYTQKGAANRRAKTVRGARVVTVADWEDERIAAGKPADEAYARYEARHAAEDEQPTEAEEQEQEAIRAQVGVTSDDTALASVVVEPAPEPEPAPAEEAAAQPEVEPEAVKAARRGKYAQKQAEGPAVEVEADGEWTFHRRYECDTRAARAARGMATRQHRTQVHARIVDADGAVLLDTDTDELTVKARQSGEVLSGIRPL